MTATHMAQNATPPQQNLGSQGAPQKRSVGHTVLTALGILLCVILVPILVVNCILLVKGATNPDKVPSVGGVVPFIVLSDSMYPQIQSGDLIVCREVDPSAVREGDVISFFDPESTGSAIVTHRVHSVSTAYDGSLGFVTKGDANNTADSTPVPAQKVVGTYLFRVPGLGNVAMFMQTTQGLVLCVVCPVILLIAYDVLRRRSYDKKSQAETDALRAELEALKSQAPGGQAEGSSSRPEQN